jgi:hypothetical protein
VGLERPPLEAVQGQLENTPPDIYLNISTLTENNTGHPMLVDISGYPWISFWPKRHLEISRVVFFAKTDILGYSEISHYISIEVSIGLSQDISGCFFFYVNVCQYTY